jgi:hypothetical protein
MMRVGIVALLVFASGLVVPTGAQRPATLQGPLASAKALVCSFPTFAATRRTDAAVEVLTGSQDFSFQIDSFDFRRNRARIVGAGTTPVTMLATPTGINVIEQTPAGNLNMTTIFVGGGQGNSFLSVHSRHLGEMDAAPSPSQAYGSCVLQ